MKRKLYFWIEEYLFNPNRGQRVLSFALLPLTLIYCVVVYIKRATTKAQRFSIPIISIGNLIVGGSGKTPFTISLARKLNSPAVILRGYKRESSGLLTVSQNGSILSSVKQSGDEAYLIASSVKNATVIVSEDRKIAIKKAIELGAKVILLDDGFSKVSIDKFDILLKNKNEPINSFCLPSGPYREKKSLYSKTDLLLSENRDFERKVTIKNPTKNMILITAISKPQRLDKFLPQKIKKIYFPDHYNFTKEELKNLVKKHNATSILTTQKDAVKMQDMQLNISLLELELLIDENVFKSVDKFIEDFDNIPQNF
jgi:tetraacyldisaccharide 4'-kinase